MHIKPDSKKTELTAGLLEMIYYAKDPHYNNKQNNKKKKNKPKLKI